MSDTISSVLVSIFVGFVLGLNVDELSKVFLKSFELGALGVCHLHSQIRQVIRIAAFFLTNWLVCTGQLRSYDECNREERTC